MFNVWLIVFVVGISLLYAFGGEHDEKSREYIRRYKEQKFREETERINRELEKLKKSRVEKLKPLFSMMRPWDQGLIRGLKPRLCPRVSQIKRRAMGKQSPSIKRSDKHIAAPSEFLKEQFEDSEGDVFCHIPPAASNMLTAERGPALLLEKLAEGEKILRRCCGKGSGCRRHPEDMYHGNIPDTNLSKMSDLGKRRPQIIRCGF